MYGSKSSFDYFTGSGAPNPGPTDGIRRIRQTLGDGVQRVVTFTVTPPDVRRRAWLTMQYEGADLHEEPVRNRPRHLTQLWLTWYVSDLRQEPRGSYT